MEFSQEWKSLFPISSVHILPLILQSPSLGPLFFNPLPRSLSLLLSSRSILSPHFLPPPPQLSLSRFLYASTYRGPLILSSSADSIAAAFDNPLERCSTAVSHNRLEPLRCPGNQVLVFFPTGVNLGSVGFVVLSVRDSRVMVDSVFRSNHSKVLSDHRIVRLTACPVFGSVNVGYLLASTLCGVHWFSVTMDLGKPSLISLGEKMFKSSSVVHACWNPHLTNECLVLLENGKLFLFDMNKRLVCMRLRVPWNETSEWFSCEFSWHPKIIVVANSKAVYVVDMRFGKYETSCLVTVESLNVKEVVGEDHFVSFSKADNDGYLYSVASGHWLILCDVRKPLTPVLRWAHKLQEPRYMTALPLSSLRSNPSDEKYVGVSDMGFAIVLGSFWNNDFSIFCYGHCPPDCISAMSSRMAKFSYPFYAWEFPSLLSLCDENCFCADCLLVGEFDKEDLPEWIKWQQKKELVLGFFILDKDFSSFLPKVGEHGGFTLVRLMSSGKLELQQYSASWKARTMAKVHEEMEKYLKDSLLCPMGDRVYKPTQKNLYERPVNLYAHLTDRLAKVLFSKFKKTSKNASEQKCPNERFMKFMDEKMKSFGCRPPISDLSVSDIFRDVMMPTSLYEVVSRVMWIKLPMDILEVAFPLYPDVHGTLIDLKKTIFDFPVTPLQDQLPLFFLKRPCHRSNKWSRKVQPSDDFVGPVLPLPASLVEYEISKHGYSYTGKINEFSPEKEFSLQCKSITCLAKEMGVLYSSAGEEKEYAVSLVNDSEEAWFESFNQCPFILYEPSTSIDELSCLDVLEEPRGCLQEDERFNLVVAKLRENETVDKETSMDDVKIFDDVSLVELNYYNSMKHGNSEYELLKSISLKWHDAYIPYQSLCARCKPRPQNIKPWPLDTIKELGFLKTHWGCGLIWLSKGTYDSLHDSLRSNMSLLDQSSLCMVVTLGSLHVR